MAANFQHMGGVGQMMPQQQQQRQQQQRPPQGNPSSNIQQMIYQTLNSQTGPLTGWQATVLIQERMSLVFNIIGNLRLASQHQPNPPTLNKMIDIGLKFERDIFDRSVDKATYKQEVQMKLDQLLARRVENSQNLQQSINMQAQQQAQGQAQAAQNQQMMLNQHGMQGQGPRNMPQQSAQQGFHHLQHQMQPSALPGQQPQPPQMALGMQTDGMPPNMTPNQQQQFLAMQQSQQRQQPLNVPGRPQNGQGGMSQQDMSLVMDLATKMMAGASEQEKASLRANLQSKMDQQAFQRYQQQGMDPVFLYFRNQAVQKLRTEKQRSMAQAQSQLAMSQQQASQNIPTTAPPMQQQRSMNPSPLHGQTQPPTSMGGDLGSFMGNVGNLIDQQQQGVMAQEAGQMVVPVSGAQRNPTPQPGVMPGQQGPGPNPNARAQQQQQQMFNAQQAQQAQAQAQAQAQRMQFAAQQQSQAAARANAQQKAQQMALQGQPGGMGNGPMPPQQSPAMGTLNTPLRTPAHQMGQTDIPQLNPNAQFGQPIDPRSNQRQPGPGNAAFAAMYNAIPQEQQQRLQALPPDKLNEVVTKWHQQRMNAGTGQAGRPPMPMQDNPQMRPQVPPSGQFNPQNPVNQFAMANPGQRQPQAGMTPQQQLVLQEQMARLQQGNSLQQRTGLGGGLPNEQRLMMQMDSIDFPPLVYTHAQMPRGIPPDVKKWGPLKQWAQNNSNVSSGTLDHIKNFQRMHYQQMVRAKAGIHNGGQPGIQPGGQPGQGGMPIVQPGMPAPVANMSNGQIPMSVGNGMAPGQLRQPTMQEIQHARAHPSRKMAHATDEQIRNFLFRQYNQTAPQQQQNQQRQAHLQQLQMANHGQQPRHGPPEGQIPPMPVAPVQQPKQPQSESAQPNTGAVNNNRTARPSTNGRAPPQNPSPAQGPRNNLKRASSDDVVEVPNPNLQQLNRSIPQTAQGQQAVLQQPRQLTPQQLATMDPEAKKAYEQSVQMWKAQRLSQANAEDMKKLKSFSVDEALRAREPLPDIPMDPQTKETMVNLLRQIHTPLSNVAKAVPKWFAVTHDENRARIFFRTRHRLGKQFKDPEMTQPKDVFSIRPAEVEQARIMLGSMVKDLSDRFPTMKKDSSAQGPPVPPAQSHAPAVLPPVTSGTPLNAHNLQQQQQQLNKIHQRSGSRSSHTPAAPTSAQPPFPFGVGATSPHGTPSYNPKMPAVTQDNLHIPARKKQKQNNGQNTPGSNASPQVGKVSSPEFKRQPAPEAKPQPKPALCCSEPECDRHNVGFDSEEALRLHTQEEHIQPLENPVKYAQDNLASLLGLDSQGRPKGATQEAGAKMGSSDSKQGYAPNIKTESMPGGAVTPVNRQTSMNRQPSVAGVKPSATSNPKGQPVSTKEALAKLQAGQRDSIKQSSQHAQETATIDPWADQTVDPHDLLFQSFQGFESGAGGAISDINVYRSITPNDTPESSKDGVSEPNSDISDGVGLDISLDIFDESWQPFGPSDTDLLNMSSFDGSGEEDLLMFEDDKVAPNFQSWDDIEIPNFDKPFTFDTSMYSMHAD
ncbi:hypothetical protein D0Z07_6279 [Hyphodiscus hymeniophilus]|uniref:Mediator complex subunit 15 KIX domain-containing protein n=1 Tax=Hyphodiscus hymeniophilus TaxID=353542 RepID=A0A9P6VF42_9HELO|nr:hypothetical protein D0Z07_6279 [Hyphodiscus hymeniophilus]